MPRLVDAIRASDRFVPKLSLVAEADRDIVGHVMLSRVRLEPHGDVLTLSPLGVVPAWQRRGVGEALTRAALAAARKSGETLVVLEGVPAYYPRFGFVRARRLRIEPPHDVPDEAWMALPLTDEPRDWSGRVVYPPAFAEVSQID